MNLSRFLPIILLFMAMAMATAQAQAEEASTAPAADETLVPAATPVDAGVSNKSATYSGKMHGGGHGKKHHGGHANKHQGKGAGMKHEMMQHRIDMEKRITRIEERLAIIKTMLEQLLQR